MVRSASLFSQLLSLIPRHRFHKAVQEHRAEHGAKGLTCWDQFVAMMFCQLASANTLREIHGGLASAFGRLRHLGLKDPPPRSTLSYANAHRSWQFVRDTFYATLETARDIAGQRQRSFRFKNPLVSIDATVIDLCCTVFDWARYQRTKGAIKLHLMLDHQGCLPAWAMLTDGKTHEVRIARQMSFAPGTIVACDMGYVDYKLFARWCKDGVWFVTRLKPKSAYRVVASRPLPQGSKILADEEIEFTVPSSRKACPHRLRHVVAWDEDNQRQIHLLTNHLTFGATTIARIYKDRWQIELFFKALKQYLKVKTFVGTSENAVQIQIWTALLAILLLKMLKLKSAFGWHLSQLAAMVRMNLLTYRDLWGWLDDPYDHEATGPPTGQATLFPL